MNAPCISVLMPVYNGELFVRKAIESILAQTFKDFELLIFDDGSTDSTRSIIDSFDDERIKPLHSDTNVGYVSHLNKGLILSKANFIARMDADDISKPDRFQKQFDFLSNNPEVGVVGSCIEYINEEGVVTGLRMVPKFHTHICWQLLFCNPICHPSVMIRRNILINGQTWKNEKMPAEDYDLWLRLSSQFNIANLPDVLLQYRLHSQSISKLKTERQFALMAESLSKTVSELYNLRLSVEESYFLIKSSLTKVERPNFDLLDLARKIDGIFWILYNSKNTEPVLKNILKKDYASRLGLISINQMKVNFMDGLRLYFKSVKLNPTLLLEHLSYRFSKSIGNE